MSYEQFLTWFVMKYGPQVDKAKYLGHWFMCGMCLENTVPETQGCYESLTLFWTILKSRSFQGGRRQQWQRDTVLPTRCGPVLCRRNAPQLSRFSHLVALPQVLSPAQVMATSGHGSLTSELCGLIWTMWRLIVGLFLKRQLGGFKTVLRNWNGESCGQDKASSAIKLKRVPKPTNATHLSSKSSYQRSRLAAPLVKHSKDRGSAALLPTLGYPRQYTRGYLMPVAWVLWPISPERMSLCIYIYVGRHMPRKW